jgi:PST family polysaccharide transporter
MAASRAISLLSMVVLARLLSPTDFGIMAVPTLVITYLETVGDLGTGAALVQVRERREQAALVTLAFNLVMAVAWWAAMVALAAPVSSFFGRDDTAPAMQALAWVFAIKALGNTQEALLLHDLDFRSRSVPEVGRAGVKAVVSIGLALLGQGAWSLVWGHVLGTAAWVALTWVVVPWRPWRHLAPESLREARATVRPMLAFGSQVVLVNLLAAVLHHLDDVVVGRVAGVAVLGVYATVSKLPEACITTLTWAVGKVSFPAFARTSHDAAARSEIYLAALRFVAVVALPAAALLGALSHPVVLLALGHQWIEGAPLLKWLAACAAFRALGSHAGDLFKGAGRPDLLRNLALVKACITVPALVLAGWVTRSAEAVAATFALATLATSQINLWVACRTLALPLGRALREVLAPALAAAAGAGVALAMAPLVPGWAAWADLLVRGAAGLLAAAAVTWRGVPDVRRLVAAGRTRLLARPS